MISTELDSMEILVLLFEAMKICRATGRTNQSVGQQIESNCAEPSPVRVQYHKTQVGRMQPHSFH